VSAEINAEDILSDFAMEDALTPDVLGTYIERYPDLAVELTDLFHDLALVDLSTAVDPIPLEPAPQGEVLAEGVATVRSALSGPGLRELARRLGLPRDFISGFRDARIRLGSVPANLLINLAREIDAKIQYFIAYLVQQRNYYGIAAFKADVKPQAPTVLEFDEFIESLHLNESEVAALRKLEGSSGPD
jgi:hypothetical protein